MELVVCAEEANQRLDVYLSRQLGENASRSYLQELIKAGNITLNGLAVKVHHRIKKGDLVKAIMPLPTESTVKPEDISLNILYEDQEVIVIDKPAGLVVHPTERIKSGTLVNALLAHTHLAQRGLPLRPGIVHRLDKDTSGVLVAAKTDQAYWKLIEQFKTRSINREYLALVYGVMPQDNGRIEVPIGRPAEGGVQMRIGGRLARSAATNFKVEQRFTRGFTLLRLKLETGRTHQIRLHLNFIGYPIVGDKVYGRKKAEKVEGALNLFRQALHAHLLGFCHPQSGEYLEFVSPLPQDMAGFIP